MTAYLYTYITPKSLLANSSREDIFRTDHVENRRHGLELSRHVHVVDGLLEIFRRLVSLGTGG